MFASRRIGRVRGGPTRRRPTHFGDILPWAIFFLGGLTAADGPNPSAGASERPRLDPDGMLVVQGQRRFVFGCYWNPETEEGLVHLRHAGFNLVRGRADRASLDEIARAQMLAWIPLGGIVSPASEQDEQKLQSLARPLLDHAALAVWEVPDEALWNAWYGRQQRLASEDGKLRQLCEDQTKSGRNVSAAGAPLASVAAPQASRLGSRRGCSPPDPRTLGRRSAGS